MQQMQQHDIHQFLKGYFQSTECSILEEGNGYLTVQLTIDQDKELMNRPFYWHYLEKVGGEPNPASLTFITNEQRAPQDIKGEKVHFGSPRLHQIFQATRRFGSAIRLYEANVARSTHNTALHPWLNMNVMVSYQCDHKRDYLLSLGIHLITGNIIEDFHELLKGQVLTPKIPDFTFTLSPIIKPKSGFNRLHQYIEKHIYEDDHSWAKEAKERWKQDLDLLNHFYEDIEEKPSTYDIEKKALQDQYEPRISVNVVNGGIFYLQEGTVRTLLQRKMA
jgi:hypothetical protein